LPDERLEAKEVIEEDQTRNSRRNRIKISRSESKVWGIEREGRTGRPAGLKTFIARGDMQNGGETQTHLFNLRRGGRPRQNRSGFKETAKVGAQYSHKKGLSGVHGQR